MSATDRRAVMRCAAAALLLPALSALPLRTLAQGPRFAPPAGPMLYTRRLERGLADGAAFVVSRGFEVRFQPEASGYLVDGRQVEVQVDAPEALAAFVQIEREREERGLFPLRLDAGGAIAAGAGTPLATRLDEAVRAALAALETRSHGPAERAELVQFVNAFHQSAGTLMTELPRDLFAPAETPRSERREVVLPGGESGEVAVTFSATRDPATGLMRQAQREVVTVLDGARRRTVESWRLDPLGG
jgi:hypothetical protein